MSDQLKWTETPPSTPGHYWVRRKHYRPSVQEFPFYGVYPRTWQHERQDGIDCLIENGELDKAKQFAELDISTFIREYYGPIVVPE
jgi:hypothetical protein